MNYIVESLAVSVPLLQSDPELAGLAANRIRRRGPTSQWGKPAQQSSAQRSVRSFETDRWHPSTPSWLPCNSPGGAKFRFKLHYIALHYIQMCMYIYIYICITCIIFLHSHLAGQEIGTPPVQNQKHCVGSSDLPKAGHDQYAHHLNSDDMPWICDPGWPTKISKKHDLQWRAIHKSPKIHIKFAIIYFM